MSPVVPSAPVAPPGPAGTPSSDRAAHGERGAWIDARPPGAPELAAGLARLPRTLWGERALIAALVRRDLRARLTGTLFGRAWPLLQPLLSFAIYWFLFTRLLGFRMPSLPAELSGAMGVWMFTGVLVWSAFSEAITRAAHTVEGSSSLLTKVAFPAEILPLEAVLSSLALFVPGIVAFLAVCALTPVWPAPGAELALIPLLLFLQGVLTLGLAWTVAALQVFVKDTAHALSIVLTVGMLFTPVFWVPSARVIPEIAPWLPWVEWNPLHHLLVGWRTALMGSRPDFLFEGDLLRSLALVALWAFGALAFGHALFQLGKRRFADEV